MFLRFGLRDLVIVTVALVLWWQLGPLSVGEGVLSDLFGVVAGVALGACAYVLHEWGHFAGALASRSVVRPPEHLRSVYLFSYDSRRNSRRQFLVMSVGGFIVTGLAVWIAYAWLPDDQLASRVARGLVLFLASLGVFIEFPLVFWALLRPTLPPVETFRTHREEQHAAANAITGR
ncbi:MAG: hypothetical protein JSU66_11795 [Deltaproteobacteria bacterium]|nr:MAG: hypothetical protein JSU66_11795 [Deltaproteobacteria bacterium]